MRSVKPPAIFRWLSPRFLTCSIAGREHSIFLTFDDGPVPEATPEIIAILEAYEAKATFFMVGDNVRKHSGLYQSIIDAGHAIGNHTFHHLNGWHTPPAAYAEDVFRCKDFFDTPLFRPPYGRVSPSQFFLLRKEFRFVLWSVLSYDFHRGVTAEQCLRNVMEHTCGGSVVVFHDSVKSIDKLRIILPRYLSYFREQGFSFEKIDAEMVLPAATPGQLISP